MRTKPIILVTGATGAQGGSVARMLLKNKKFAVRILTRNPDSQRARVLQRAGAEIVKGDLDDIRSLEMAMLGCYGVFGVTNFWEHYAKEYQQGLNLIDAVKTSGIRHFVMHSMEDYSKLSNGRYSVPQYDIKAALEQYAKREQVAATFVHMSFYFENFFSLFPLQKGQDKTFYFGFPQGDTKLAMVSVDDLGGVVARIFNNPHAFIGRTVGVVGDDRTGHEYAQILSNVLERNIEYYYISRNEYAAYNFPGAEELANMFEVQRLYIPERQAELEESYKMNPEMQTFEKWATKNKQRFLNHINSHLDVFVI